VVEGLSPAPANRRPHGHPGLTLALIHEAGVALARKKIREAREYLKKASAEMKLAHDLMDGNVALFFETKGWLGLAEGQPSDARWPTMVTH